MRILWTGNETGSFVYARSGFDGNRFRTRRSAGAIQAVKLGKKVLIAEKQQVLGGVCTNSGTIPSKTLREAIIHFSGLRHRAVYGRGYQIKHDISFADLNQRVSRVIAHENEVARSRLLRTGVDVVHGTASFEGPNTVGIDTVNGRQLVQAKRILISVGTVPYRADRVPFNNRNIIDTDTMFGPDYVLDRIPRSMLSLGDGASELLHIGQAVMAFNGSISYFVDTVFNYPTLAEAYKIAALNGLKRLGAQRQVHDEPVKRKEKDSAPPIPLKDEA